VVDLIPIRKLYKYESLRRVDGPGGRRYVDGNEVALPSVTTILSGTKDKSGLDAWAARVGEAEANRIKNEAATVGTHMHNVIERMIAYRDLPRPTNWLMVRGYEMGYRLVNTYFPNLNEIWGSEVPLYYPGKYAGTTDLVGIYRGNAAIVDFKQSLRPKKHDWIADYFHQLAAYALAHDVVHGTSITHGYVLVAVQNGETQEFSTTGSEFDRYKEAWMKRVEAFIQASAGPPPASQPPP
jgi:hypothetical protein